MTSLWCGVVKGGGILIEGSSPRSDRRRLQLSQHENKRGARYGRLAWKPRNAGNYWTSSDVIVAPFICGRTDDCFTTLRVILSTQIVELPASPSAGLSSTFQASKEPAGTVTFSLPVTLSCITLSFCFIKSKLRNVVE